METDKKKSDWLIGIDKKRLDDQIVSLSTLKNVKEKERELAIGNNEAKSKYDELIDVISEKLEKKDVSQKRIQNIS